MLIELIPRLLAAIGVELIMIAVILASNKYEEEKKQ
jgi:hypothetical protein